MVNLIYQTLHLTLLSYIYHSLTQYHRLKHNQSTEKLLMERFLAILSAENVSFLIVYSPGRYYSIF